MRFFFVALLVLGVGRLSAQVASLLPVPQSVRERDSRFVVDSTLHFVITGVRDGRLDRAIERAIVRLEQRTGQQLAHRLDASSGGGAVVVEVVRAGGAVQGVNEDEGYELDISAELATLRAETVVGAMRGLETLLQLVSNDSSSFFLPGLTITDAPRFPWRGLLVDASRHFMPVDQIKRTLDGMSLVKLNVLHWHLSDDQGIRVESRRFPKLHLLGSDGLYYTQAQIRDVVAYARDRGIRVVPEFDMPGHSTAWFVGYPQYSAQRAPIVIRREWGGADAIFDPTREATYTFIARFIAEFVPLFPDAYWHIGGDEVEGKHWDSNPRIVAWRKRHGLRDNDALQAHFNKRLSKILAAHGRRMVGWDEVLHPDLPPNTVVQSWRGTQYLADAATRGFSGLLSAPWYLDHIKPATDFYVADPVPQFDGLTAAQQRLILGGEACMWSEYITAESADSRIWPRLGAVAERLWSPREVTDVGSLYRRLDILAGRLEAMGLRVQSHSARMLRKLAPGLDVTPIESLFTAVQPPSFGQSTNGRMMNQRDPLSRLVDAARPDPPGRWMTERLVRRLALNAADTPARDSLAVLFAAWVNLQPSVARLGALSPTLAQALPVNNALARVANIGLEALGYIGTGARPQPGWSEALVTELQQYDKPQETLRVAITAEVRKLVAVAAVNSH
ncbi:MAG: family 20 glycosylhydrolase [Gemmatimonadaceae bacterium]|nr:family 20 glycosylhydrolase [Gemmatimonadaceae bacterium]